MCVVVGYGTIQHIRYSVRTEWWYNSNTITNLDFVPFDHWNGPVNRADHSGEKQTGVLEKKQKLSLLEQAAELLCVIALD